MTNTPRIQFHLLLGTPALVLVSIFMLPAFSLHNLEKDLAGKHGRFLLAAGFRLNLTHRDFSNSAKASFAERMQVAVLKSRSRLNHFQIFMSSKLPASRAASTYGFKVPLYAGDGAFLTTIKIGSPGSSYTAIVDTGSDLVWRQCQPCTSCFSQTDPIFDPSRSSTYKEASCNDSLCKALPQTECSPNCQYTYAYGDMSYTRGDFAYDTLTLMDTFGHAQALSSFGFGCGHDNEGRSFAGAEGLIGLGQGPASLLSQLSFQQFSYCLVSITDSASQTSPLYLGKAASLGGNVQSTPIITNFLEPSLYYIGLKGISVGGNLLSIPSGTFDLQSDGSGGTIIDSGTTLTYLEQSGYEPLLRAFESAIHLPRADASAIGLDLCYQRSGTVPRLTLHFNGADFDLPTENYFVTLEGLFCLAMAASSGISILGNIQQQNFHILYERGAKTLSFSPATCADHS